MKIHPVRFELFHEDGMTHELQNNNNRFSKFCEWFKNACKCN